jgi:hypothetical protein
LETSSTGFQVRNITQAQPKAKSKLVVPIYKLTPAQMKEKRVKGLCFKYDGKWGPEHKCGGSKLFLIEEEAKKNYCCDGRSY